VLNTKILDLGDPKQGDVVVFRYPSDESKDYIKRVVGVPGDVVEIKGRQLYVNGEPIKNDILGPYLPKNKHDPQGAAQATEYLPGRTHDVVFKPPEPPFNPKKFDGLRRELGEGEYFVMGDNRDNSEDSRVWGIVPEENLVGKAFLIWMHLGFSNLDRIGTVIK